MNRYITTTKRYFSSSEKYNITLILEEDGTIDEPIVIEDGKDQFKLKSMDLLVELRKLINDVIFDAEESPF